MKKSAVNPLAAFKAKNPKMAWEAIAEKTGLSRTNLIKISCMTAQEWPVRLFYSTVTALKAKLGVDLTRFTA